MLNIFLADNEFITRKYKLNNTHCACWYKSSILKFELWLGIRLYKM